MLFVHLQFLQIQSHIVLLLVNSHHAELIGEGNTYLDTLSAIYLLVRTLISLRTVCFTLTFHSWHWAACMRRLVPLHLQTNPVYENDWTEEKTRDSRFYLGSWLVLDPFDHESVDKLRLEDIASIFTNYSMLNKYTRTMMITLKLALQSGYGAETADSIYNILVSTFLMFGGWIYATYVLILMSNVFMASANSENKFEEVSKEIDAFCESKGLSKNLTEKIKTFYKCKFKKHYFNEDAIRESTTASLRKEIMLHSCSHLIAKVPLFKGIPHLILESIISCLKLEIYFPGDVIIQADTIGDGMFFIVFGTAGIYSPSGMFVTS